MSCCGFLLSFVEWVTGLYTAKRYEADSDSSDDVPVPPVPRFRDLGAMKHRVTRTYELRPTKAVCYRESDED